MALPILYSYRRCPYAMRARMGLKIAGIEVKIREVSLSDKPAHMMQVSPKATVPVLVLTDGKVIDESLDIMQWALAQHDPEAWLDVAMDSAMQLISDNDTTFKRALDAYKYPERFLDKTQKEHRADGEVFLVELEQRLLQHAYLIKETPCIADVAIFPFVRQFAAVDSTWFEQSEYVRIRFWLERWVKSELFNSIMQKYKTYVE
ncbi:MAG: glutathione S-transferase [Methylophilus sp.]